MKKTNKIIAMAIAVAAITSSMSVMADDTVKVYVDGEQLTFDVQPQIIDDRTLVPMRAIFEALGAEVTWDGETRTASAVKGEDTVKITIDSNALYKNDVVVELDVPAQIIDDRTLVPVRAISESFDAEVVWDGETRSVVITNAVPEATPAPETTSAPEATTAPDDTAKLEFTEADIKKMTDQKEAFRYSMEQSELPQYFFEHSDEIYELLASPEDFTQTVYGYWDGIAMSFAIQVGAESETTYEIDLENTDEDSLIEMFSDVIISANLDAYSFFDGGTCAESGNGTRVGVVTFKEADSMVQCKYLGVVKSKDGDVRYFTAENDIMDTENWYFCEVTPEGRGTIGMFEKKDDKTDLETFINTAIGIYEEK